MEISDIKKKRKKKHFFSSRKCIIWRHYYDFKFLEVPKDLSFARKKIVWIFFFFVLTKCMDKLEHFFFSVLQRVKYMIVHTGVAVFYAIWIALVIHIPKIPFNRVTTVSFHFLSRSHQQVKYDFCHLKCTHVQQSAPSLGTASDSPQKMTSSTEQCCNTSELESL